MISFFRKAFITGEIDLAKSLMDSSSTVTKGAFKKSSRVTIKLSGVFKSRIDDVKTDLYLNGLISTMPKITFDSISQATQREEGNETVTDQESKEFDRHNSKEYNSHYDTTVQRRDNSSSRTTKPKQSEPLLYEKKEVSGDLDFAIQKGFSEASQVSKIDGFDFEVTEKRAGYRFDYVSISFLNPADEDYFIKKHDFILKRISNHLMPKVDNRGQRAKRNLYFNKVNGKLTTSYNGYVLAVEKAESSIMDKRNYYHMLSPNSLEFVVEVNGEPRVFDMAKAPHPLILGTTGAGKSAMQNSMISSFIKMNTSDTLSLELISPKLDADGNDFVQFQGSDLLSAPVLTATNKTMTQFLTDVALYCERAVEIMNKRERDISQGIRPLSYHLLAIDEIVDVVAIQKGGSEEDKKNNKIRNKIIYLMNTIAMKGRSSKVHLFLATQSPRADYLGAIKANLNFIALKVSNGIEAKVSGFLGADELLGRGDGYMSIDGEFVRFQSPM